MPHDFSRGFALCALVQLSGSSVPREQVLYEVGTKSTPRAFSLRLCLRADGFLACVVALNGQEPLVALAPKHITDVVRSRWSLVSAMLTQAATSVQLKLMMGRTVIATANGAAIPGGTLSEFHTLGADLEGQNCAAMRTGEWILTGRALTGEEYEKVLRHIVLEWHK